MSPTASARIVRATLRRALALVGLVGLGLGQGAAAQPESTAARALLEQRIAAARQALARGEAAAPREGDAFLAQWNNWANWNNWPNWRNWGNFR